MNRYDSATPRFVCGIAAAAMTAITITVLVVLPSALEPDSKTFAMLASEALATTQCDSQCVEMTAAHKPSGTPVHFRTIEPKCKQES